MRWSVERIVEEKRRAEENEVESERDRGSTHTQPTENKKQGEHERMCVSSDRSFCLHTHTHTHTDNRSRIQSCSHQRNPPPRTQTQTTSG